MACKVLQLTTKNILLILILHSVPGFCQLSDTLKNVKTVNDNFLLSLRISTPEKIPDYLEYVNEPTYYKSTQTKNMSYCLGVLPSIKISNGNYLRLKLMWTHDIVDGHSDSRNIQSALSFYDISDLSILCNTYEITPGIQWSFSLKTISLYCGFETPFYVTGKTNEHYSIERFDTMNRSQGIEVTDIVVDGGYTVGVGGFAGFDYFFLKRIAIGAEFSMALLLTKMGGTIVSNTIGTGSFNINSTANELNTYQKFNLSNPKFGLDLLFKL